jgi:hypothetical protein
VASEPNSSGCWWTCARRYCPSGKHRWWPHDQDCMRSGRPSFIKKAALITKSWRSHPPAVVLTAQLRFRNP